MPLTESSHNNVKNARGFVLAMLLLVLVAAFHLMLTSNKVKVTLQITSRQESEQAKLRRATFFCQKEQLALTQFVLNGNNADLEQLERAKGLLHQMNPGESRHLKELISLENDWYRSLAEPMIAERRALDAGHGTVALLAVHYLELGGRGWAQRLSPLSVYTDPEPAEATFERLRQGLAESLDLRVGVGIALCFVALLIAIVGLRYVTRLEEALQESGHA